MLNRRYFLGSALAAVLAVRVNAGYSGKPYRIGISDAVVDGKPDQKVSESMCGVFEVAGKPKCEFDIRPAEELARHMDAQDINISVLTGIEYAWLKNKYPELLPLVTAYTTGVVMKACLLVREDSKERTLMDLQGDTICLPKRLKRHAYLYLHSAIQKCGGSPHGFFGQSQAASNSHEGIESVIENKADAILVDSDSWKAYQERKPARSKQLRVLHESGAFPTPVVLYQKKSLNRFEVLLLKIGLCTAHEKPFSRQMLNFWGVSKFVPYGKAYQRVVDSVLKEIPASFTPGTLVAKQ